MTEYSFVDMHIHSSYSDEELCDITIEQILTKAQERATAIGADCVISVADHNSILGVIEAREILKNNPEKYPNVKFINGIEFTTDLVEMSQLFDDTRVFTRCHTLAYGYDENNKELIAYSKLAHKTFSIAYDNIGMQICAARRTICEKYNIYIPFSVYLPMVDLDKSVQFKQEFINITQEYLKQQKIDVSSREIDVSVGEFIKDAYGYVREASAQGRLKLSEISKLVKDAGGGLVLAHSALIRVTVKGINYLEHKYNLPHNSLYNITNNKYGNNTDLAHIKNKKFVLNKFIDAFEQVANCKLSGLEKYYSTNITSGLYKEIEQICQEREMYETCGSDYHGEKMHPNKNVGNCLHDDAQTAYKNEFNYISSESAPINISAISGVECLLNKKHKSLDKAILKTSNGKYVPAEHLDIAVNAMHSLNSKRKVSKYIIAEVDKIDFNQRIKELVETVGKLNAISDNVASPKQQAKLLLRLNLFAENIVFALKDVKFKSNKYEYIRTLDDYQQVLTLLAEINRKYNDLIMKNPELLQDLKYDMKHYYNKNYLAIANLANYKLMPVSETEYQK